MSKTSREVWIGQVEVKPEAGNPIFDGAPGAFSNVVALARDELQYRWQVAEVFGELGLDVIGFQNVEPLVQRLGQSWPDDNVPEPVEGVEDIRALASRLSEAVPVLYDTFYIYESE